MFTVLENATRESAKKESQRSAFSFFILERHDDHIGIVITDLRNALFIHRRLDPPATQHDVAIV